MGKPFLDKKGFPLPFPKNFFNKKGAEGTGRAPTNLKQVFNLQHTVTSYRAERSVVECISRKRPCEMDAENGGVRPLLKGRRSAVVGVRGPAEELPIWERLMPRAASPIEA